MSGFFASASSLPFDYVKTQIQKMQPDAEGKYPYTGSLDCVMKTLKSGGPLKFYTGFPVYCVRIAPHAMVSSYLLPSHHPPFCTDSAILSMFPSLEMLMIVSVQFMQLTLIFLHQIQKFETSAGL